MNYHWEISPEINQLLIKLEAQKISLAGYGFRGLIPFEKYIESHRQEYYRALESSREISHFIKYFLEALTSEIGAIIVSLSDREEKREDLLLPRRRELLAIISDHPLCTFDMIRRRFLAVNEKTLHYDLSQLIKKGFVQKIGATRGALYKRSESVTLSI
ncbi:MAG: hypothetical protein UW41_C0005G0042 [Candidatus Collierbacteria bacterium GW2011_GWC2_44_18]|uniref:HTH deoR-type domain-containing protein n=2 Tax=Microgenomates group TaxID=1794810 RepID=A0A0G1LGD7_9BACT|nr:MAG: hypothetical protein UW41_C0005G0042 [Candidatus Collierbacteria bacterium GW2011_GWC2_44_18]KKT67777.1 MAG: hypothetical protein UW60_C0001G0055 [Candidatus Woesebacteria bacterium GW2011_GWA2_44_33]